MTLLAVAVLCKDTVDSKARFACDLLTGTGVYLASSEFVGESCWITYWRLPSFFWNCRGALLDHMFLNACIPSTIQQEFCCTGTCVSVWMGAPALRFYSQTAVYSCNIS